MVGNIRINTTSPWFIWFRRNYLFPGSNQKNREGRAPYSLNPHPPRCPCDPPGQPFQAETHQHPLTEPVCRPCRGSECTQYLNSTPNRLLHLWPRTQMNQHSNPIYRGPAESLQKIFAFFGASRKGTVSAPSSQALVMIWPHIPQGRSSLPPTLPPYINSKKPGESVLPIPLDPPGPALSGCKVTRPLRRPNACGCKYRAYCTTKRSNSCKTPPSTT